MLFILNDVENGPENQIIHSCLAELRHDGSDEKRQFEYNENPASAGFLLSGDTTGVFARCIASVPLSHRHRALKRVSSDVKFLVW